MKKMLIFLIVFCCLSFCIVPNKMLKASIKEDINFIGKDSTLSMEEKKERIKINNNCDTETSITFLVHGLGSSASCWSNTLGNIYGVNVDGFSRKDEFGYDPNSIIEVIRRRVNADVYFIDSIDTSATKDSITNEVVDIQINSFKLEKLFVKMNPVGQLVYDSDNYVSEIENANNHIVVVYDASSSSSGAVINVAYKELEYVINKITYDVYKLKNSKVKINLIGHSRGGLLNMKYAINYPYNVDSLVSLGTPYNGTSIYPLNDLIKDAMSTTDDIFGLDGLINCPGGQEVANMTRENNPLKDEWVMMNETYNPNINFIPIAGEMGITYMMKMLNEVKNEYPSAELVNLVDTLEKLFIDFEKIFIEAHDESYMPEYLDNNDETRFNTLLVLIVALLISNNESLTTAQKQSIVNLISEIYYSNEADELLLKTDLLIDSYSQLAEGFNVDSEGNSIYMSPYKKIFTENNSMYDNKSHDTIGVVHNVEARDLELINYILLNINFSGTDTCLNTCYLSDNSLGVMGKVMAQNENTIIIPNEISFSLYNNIPSTFQISGISNRLSTNSNDDVEIIELGKNIEKIEEGAFKKFKNIKRFNLNENDFYDIDLQNNLYSSNFERLIKFCNNNQTTFTLPDSTVEIEGFAFFNNNSLQSINLNNVYKVGEKTFYNANNLNSIFGDNLKLAGNFAFHNTIWINNVNSTTKLGKVLIKYTESEEKVILNDCTCIYSYAFVNNENIKKLICNDESIHIDKFAFINNDNLKEVFLSSSERLINAFSFVGNKDELNIYFENYSYNFFDRGDLRNCFNNKDTIIENLINCRTILTSESKNLDKGGAIYFKFDIDCAKSYTFTASSTSKLIMEIYDEEMNLLSNANTYSDDELITTIKEYKNIGTYYLKIFYEDEQNSGEVNFTYTCTWPTISKVTLGDNNLLPHLHRKLDETYINTFNIEGISEEGFYKFTVTGYDENNNEIVLRGNTFRIYRDNEISNLLYKYSMIDSSKKAFNSTMSNSMTVFLYSSNSFYVDVEVSSNNLTSLNLHIEKVEEKSVNLFDYSTNHDEVVLDFSEISKGDNLNKVELKQTGLFELNTENFKKGKFVILKQRAIVDDTLVFDNPIFYDLELNNSYQFVLFEGIYYLGFIEADVNIDLTCVIKRIISDSGSYNLEADPGYASIIGSEVTLNGGDEDGNEITQGFTRIIYLANGESRLDYYWYSSDETIARVTDYGTVVALEVNDSCYVQIMAVNMFDPSKVYVKSFIINPDYKSYESDPIENYKTLTIDTNFSNEIKIDLSDLNVPINWLQYFTWTSSSSGLHVNQFGVIIADISAAGNTYVVTGIYKLNPRVRVYLTVNVT